MFLRWRVRYSYPESIVESVVRLEPIHGALALSRLLDIPATAIYRWRARYRNRFAPLNDSAIAAEVLATLVARCEELGFHVAASARLPHDRACASTGLLQHQLATQAPLCNSVRDTAVDGAPSRICHDRADGQCDRYDETGLQKHFRLPVRSIATGRYVFDASKERPIRGVRNRMEAARHTIDTQYFLDVDCRTFAETAHMSLHHFIRMFGDMFGTSPHQYLMRVRVEAAKRLLRVSNEPIEVIATGVGYRSSISLNRAFKRIEGTSVSKFCKTLRKGSTSRRNFGSMSVAINDTSRQISESRSI